MPTPSRVAQALGPHLEPASWYQLVDDIDLSDRDWRQSLISANEALCRDKSKELSRLVPSHAPSLEVLFRNATVLALRDNPSWLIGLYVLLGHMAPKDEWCAPVQASVAKALPQKSWIHLLSPTCPQTTGMPLEGLSLEQAVRVSLAGLATSSAKISAKNFLRTVAGAGHLRRPALTRLMCEFLRVYPCSTRIRHDEFRSLPLYMQLLLVASRELRERLVASPVDGICTHRNLVRREWATKRRLERMARRLAPAIAKRDYESAIQVATAAGFISDPSTRHLLPAIAESVADALYHPQNLDTDSNSDDGATKATQDQWVPLPENLGNLLVDVFVRDRKATGLLTTLSATGDDLVTQAVRSRSPSGGLTLPSPDIVRLRNTWNEEQKSALFAAGCSRMLNASDVADLREAQFDRDAVRVLSALADEKEPEELSLAWAQLAGEEKSILVVRELLRRDSPPPQLIACAAAAARDAETYRQIRLSRLSNPAFAFAVARAANSIPAGNAWATGVDDWICAQQVRNPKSIAALESWVIARQSTLFPRLVVEAHSKTISALAALLPPETHVRLWRSVAAEQPRMPAPRRDSLQRIASALIAKAVPLVAISILQAFPRLWHGYHLERDVSGTDFDRECLAFASSAFAPRNRWSEAEDIARRTPKAVKRGLELLHDHPSRQAMLQLASHIGYRYMPRLAVVAAKGARRSGPPGRVLDECYRSYELPKQSGGKRVILVPQPWLKTIQRKLYESLLAPLGAHESAHGFVIGRSIVTNALPHVGQPLVVSCDVASAFPSVKWPVIVFALRRDLRPKLLESAIWLLMDIVCHSGGLPIGAPTSPALLNRALLRLDEIVSEEAKKRDVRYTRYADDLTFSGVRSGELLPVVRRLLKTIGLQLDPKKTNFFRPGRRQMVTGLTVNQKPAVPRRVRRRLRAAIHEASIGKQSHWHGKPASTQTLLGWATFVRMVDRSEGERLLAKLRGAP